MAKGCQATLCIWSQKMTPAPRASASNSPLICYRSHSHCCCLSLSLRSSHYCCCCWSCSKTQPCVLWRAGCHAGRALPGSRALAPRAQAAPESGHRAALAACCAHHLERPCRMSARPFAHLCHRHLCLPHTWRYITCLSACSASLWETPQCGGALVSEAARIASPRWLKSE